MCSPSSASRQLLLQVNLFLGEFSGVFEVYLSPRTHARTYFIRNRLHSIQFAFTSMTSRDSNDPATKTGGRVMYRFVLVALSIIPVLTPRDLICAAQRTTANVYGAVKDSSGALVPGVTVQFIHEQTGVQE